MALTQHPEFAEDIRRVMANPSFEIQDLRWIAPVMGTGVRLSIEDSAWTHIGPQIPWLRQDMLFGAEVHPVTVHLYFSWPKSLASERLYGHYDLLIPSERTLFNVLLPPDATWAPKWLQV